MPVFNDNELDKLFQEAADHIGPEFDERDWDQLSARLDKHDDKGGFYRTISLYSIAILLLLLMIQATWKEQYTTKLSSDTNTSSAKEAAVKNNNRITSKVLKADSNGIHAQNKTVKENNNSVTGEVESKSYKVDEVSLPESSRLVKTENTKDVQNVKSKSNGIALRSKRSESQTETDKNINVSIQKDSSHSPLTKNQTTTNIEVSGTKEKSFANISNKDSHAFNNNSKGGALDTGKQNADSAHTDIELRNDADIHNSYLNLNKQTDSLNTYQKNGSVSHSETVIRKDDNTQVSVSNEAIKLNVADLETTNQSIRGLQPYAARDRNRNNAKTNVNNEIDSLSAAKRSMIVAQSNVVPYSNDSNKTTDLNTDKKIDSSIADNQNAHTKYSDVALGSSDSTRISDSTKIQQNILQQPIDVVSKDSSDVQTEPAKKRNLFIKLPVSPDFSSVGYLKPGNAGINLGLLVEYSFNKHIAVEAGAIWSKKLYAARYASVNSVKGDCRILDMPINIKYYLTPGRGINFFVTAGLSSYLMLNEKYDYVTVTDNYNEKRWSKEYSTKNSEWFSMLNLSVGAETKVSKRLWLQVEPFFKVPIADIGAVKIKLVSMGAFFTLKYKIN